MPNSYPEKVLAVTKKRQSGSVLVVGLIILLALTLLGIAGMQTTTMEERMAGNTRNRDLAFQAAEAALREGESFLQAAFLPPFENSNGLYQYPDPASVEEPLWKSIDWSAEADDHIEYAEDIEGVAQNPRYIIEELPPKAEPGSSLAADEPVSESKLYRVTARAVGGTEKAVVILQTTYRR